MVAMLETRLTAANKAAIQQWTNRPCGALDDFEEYNLAYFEALEHELDHVFYARWRESARIDPNPEEISAWRWADQAQLARLLLAGQITPWFAMILERVRWAKSSPTVSVRVGYTS